MKKVQEMEDRKNINEDYKNFCTILILYLNLEDTFLLLNFMFPTVPPNAEVIGPFTSQEKSLK